MSKEQIAPCRCGKLAGWFEKRIVAYEQFYLPDGEASHASDILLAHRGGVRKYCFECNRDITKLIVEKP